MKKSNFPFILTLILICLVLAACSEEKTYEVIKSDSKVTESDAGLQLELQYEIVNNTDEDYYFTLVFPKYIQESLISNGEIVKLTANSNTSGVAIVSVGKDGAEMTKDTINGIMNGELPFVEQILIGKTISLKP